MTDLLSYSEKQELVKLLEEKTRRDNSRKLYTYYPDEGPLRRELYPKHLEFFKAGKDYRERGFVAANRIGKTEGAGGYETALHLTGLYPEWWEGRRFDYPVSWWAAGKTNETTRDIIQAKMLGPKKRRGTGLIPGSTIKRITSKSGIQDMADTVEVEHISGGTSVLGFKSYQQGRDGFEGTEKDGIWLDEEPSIAIYGECLIRTATTDGMIIMTMTPLEGLTETVMQFFPDGLPDA